MSTVATLPARPQRNSPRQPKPLAPVTPDVQLYHYAPGLGIGLIRIDRSVYGMFRQKDDQGRTVGVRLVKEEADEHGRHKIHDIDLAERPWRCDCEDATYRPGRPGGCKHIVALRIAAKALTPTA